MAPTDIDDRPQPAAEQPKDDATTPLLSRRTLLGTMAAGAVATACGSSTVDNNALTLQEEFVAPTTTAAPAAGGTEAAVEVAAGAPSPPVHSSGALVNSESTAGGTEVALPTPASALADPAPAAPAPSDQAATPPAEPGPPIPSDSAPAPAAPAPVEPAPAPAEPAPSETPEQPVPAAPTGPVVPPLDLAVSRLSFGYTPGMRQSVEAMGAKVFIEDQLARSGNHQATEQRLAAAPILRLEGSDLGVDAPRSGDISNALQDATIIRAAHSPNQLFEMTCQLWYDHFNVNLTGDMLPLTIPYQERVIRPNAMGPFRDLLRAVLRSGAMLIYLDNANSDANDELGINENLGRETLELYTLGIHDDQQVYTLEDIQTTALALAGWTFDQDPASRTFGDFRFDPNLAYNGGTLSILDGEWTSDGLSGQAVFDSLINFLASHPETAKHVAYKVCRRFVADQPSPGLVAAAAAVYLDNDTDVSAVLRYVLTSSEFAASGGLKMRRPFEYVVALIRALGLDANEDAVISFARDRVASLDQPLWTWVAPDGYPDTAPHWLTGSSLMARWNTAGRLAENLSIVDHAGLLPEADSVADVIAALAADMGLGTLADAEVSAIAGAAEVAVDGPGALNARQTGTVLAILLAHPLFQVR